MLSKGIQNCNIIILYYDIIIKNKQYIIMVHYLQTIKQNNKSQIHFSDTKIV